MAAKHACYGKWASPGTWFPISSDLTCTSPKSFVTMRPISRNCRTPSAIVDQVNFPTGLSTIEIALLLIASSVSRRNFPYVYCMDSRRGCVRVNFQWYGNSKTDDIVEINVVSFKFPRVKFHAESGMTVSSRWDGLFTRAQCILPL